MTLWRVSGQAVVDGGGDPIDWVTIIEHNVRHRAVLLGYSALRSNHPNEEIAAVRGTWRADEIEIPKCAHCKQSMGASLAAFFSHRCE